MIPSSCAKGKIDSSPMSRCRAADFCVILGTAAGMRMSRSRKRFSTLPVSKEVLTYQSKQPKNQFSKTFERRGSKFTSGYTDHEGLNVCQISLKPLLEAYLYGIDKLPSFISYHLLPSIHPQLCPSATKRLRLRFTSVPT